ncbi:MFS transporter [Aestuariivirga litoralis]|uniref:MFS transporter n=1 Tax=Aestuariivirga litoralis TaxID=2650924 RepID=UPI0018C5DB14|nr:MFS transporter [Aestuariivirga litoralis]MBG1231133.1 MFS transporter [Aestuariivirga litoralis]
MALSNSRILPLVVASALFMENMDSTIIATSLPAMARDLGTSPVSLKLAFTTYLITLTVFLPISAWVSDKFGAKKVFRIAMVVFTLASLCCAMAPSLGWLVAARAVQGLGGAMMVPVGRIIVLRGVPKAELVNAMAWLTVPALVGPLVGPPIGGFITTYFSWHWIFWMHLPIGILGITMATLFMPDFPPEKVAALDVKGFILSGLGLSLTVFGMTIIGRGLFTGPETALLVIAGLGLIYAYVRHAQKVPHPILDLSLLSIDTLRVSIMAGSFYRIAAGAIPFLMPLLLQLAFNLTPFQSGLITCMSAAGALMMKFLAARALKAFGYRQLLIFNGIISCAFMAAMGLFRETTPLAIIYAVLLFGGLARSLQFTSLNSIAYADVSTPDIARANGLYTVAQQLSLALGVAVAAIILESSQWLRGAAELGQADFSTAFIVVALGGLIAIPEFLKLAPAAGAALSGHAVVPAPVKSAP